MFPFALGLLCLHKNEHSILFPYSEWIMFQKYRLSCLSPEVKDTWMPELSSPHHSEILKPQPIGFSVYKAHHWRATSDLSVVTII